MATADAAIMKSRIEHTDDGRVIWTFPMDGAAKGGTLEMTAEQAEIMAHALLIQAYLARGHTPTADHFRRVRGWVLR